jgi:hypothetical protein
VTHAKRLSPSAWDALLEALSVFYWYRRDFEGFLRGELANHPELLIRLNFEEPKRQVATTLVTSMRGNEAKYRDVAIDLLVRLSEFDPGFAHLARLDEGTAKVAVAKSAHEQVLEVIGQHSAQAKERDRVREEAQRREAASVLRRTHKEVLSQLKAELMEMYGMGDHHARGKCLERLLNRLFALIDLYPKAAYSTEHEQIDGSFTFQTDDYLLEARWWRDSLQPKELNDFRVKIESKAKNVLGLMVAINGFTRGAIEKHSHSTPLVLMDGADLFAVLDDRINLVEVLERKRRHAAETGIPMLPVSQMLG